MTVTGDEADQLSRYGPFIWGTKPRCRAVKARKLLGWSPKVKSLEDEIPEAIKSEAKKLGLVQGLVK